jgi:hypothetical protein
MDCTQQYLATPIATNLGKWAESNLTSFIRQARHELDRGAGDPGSILAMGVSLCRARQDVRDGLRAAERSRWEGRTR